MTPAGGSTTTTKFAYNGWNSNMPAGTGNANFQQWAILNGDNSLQTRNIDGNEPGLNLARVDESSAPDGGGVYFLLNDYQNSVQAVVDTSGNVKDAITYNAFGTIESETDATYRGWYAWTGMETDQQTGLQYNNGRWYNAAAGTWMTQDPMGFDAGDSNLYRYVNNAPTDATDPSGLEVLPANTPEELGKIPKDIVFTDELLYKLYSQGAKGNQKYSDTIQFLIAVRDASKPGATDAQKEIAKYVDLKVYYIIDDAGKPSTDYAAQATQKAVGLAGDAAKGGGSTVNLYLGHGLFGDENKISKASLGRVGDALKDLAKVDTKGQSAPLIGYTSCFGGDYNGLVPEKLKIEGGMTDRVKINGLMPSKYFPIQFEGALKEVAKRLEKKEKTTINLFFSAFTPRKGEEDIYPADLSLRFANWKK